MDDFIDDDEGYDGESNTVKCPNCEMQIYDDAEQCPYCQNYVVWDQARRFSPWAKIMVWALIAALILPAIIAVLNLF